MKSHRRRASLAILILLSVLGPSLGEPPAQDATSHYLGHIGQQPLPISEVKFHSKSLDRELYLNVILPRGHETSETAYPRFYPRHGRLLGKRALRVDGSPVLCDAEIYISGKEFDVYDPYRPGNR